MPRTRANKNTPSKTNAFMPFLALKPYKIPHKMVFKYREGGRTVGSGRVATIIE